MVISKKKETPKCHLESYGEIINQVEQFRYLGYFVTNNDKYDAEMKWRMVLAKASFKGLVNIFNKQKDQFRYKKRTEKPYVRSIPLKSFET